ncbi:hypothetical protein TL16_g04212 [Triparma laevis f. inornata]|uniref:Uncharacterized protein n=1 Tax=Triparma laevis f. inornata TaxID=1714386 RepID=A0A9W7A457_9STRA|nr:hypothetical protein TL16_g04212 [Triparma laevis f. inornata]
MATYMDFDILNSTTSTRISAERRIHELQKAELRHLQNEEQGCYPSMEELKATLSLATEHVSPLRWTQSEPPSIPLSESTRSETWLASMLSLASPTNYLGLMTASESMLPTPYTEKIMESEKFRSHEKVEVQAFSGTSAITANDANLGTPTTIFVKTSRTINKTKRTKKQPKNRPPGSKSALSHFKSSWFSLTTKGTMGTIDTALSKPSVFLKRQVCFFGAPKPPKPTRATTPQPKRAPAVAQPKRSKTPPPHHQRKLTTTPTLPKRPATPTTPGTLRGLSRPNSPAPKRGRSTTPQPQRAPAVAQPERPSSPPPQPQPKRKTPSTPPPKPKSKHGNRVMPYRDDAPSSPAPQFTKSSQNYARPITPDPKSPHARKVTGNFNISSISFPTFEEISLVDVKDVKEDMQLYDDLDDRSIKWSGSKSVMGEGKRKK